jgi:putative ABC transport system permease protein
MLHHLKIGWRNMRKQKGYALTHILGLAVGMAASLLILELLVFEFSFDRFHTDGEQIYRVTNDRYQNGELIQHGTITYPTIGRVMEEDIPEITAHLRMIPAWGNTGVRVGEEVFSEDGVFYANGNFFDFFSFPLLAGDRKQALEAPYNLALSASMAKKYFQVSSPDQAIGKQLILDQEEDIYQVSAVFADVPANSHLQFDMVISFKTFLQEVGPSVEENWEWSDFWHYVKLQEGVNPEALRGKLDAFSETHFRGNEVSGSEEKFFLQPLHEAHLYSDYEYEIGETADGEAFELLFGIAIFILLLAWINYVNLTTARSLERAREVGLRKVMGATRNQLIKQFLSESFLYNILGLVLALTLIQLFQPAFNNWLGRPLSLTDLWSTASANWLNPLYFIMIILLGMLASGFYPAFVLSAYSPATVLKGVFKRSQKGNSLRQGLVIFQFVCSFVMITATLTVYQQINYMHDRDLGIELEQVVVLEGPYLSNWDSTWIQKIDALKQEMKKIPAVSQVTTSENLAGSRLSRMFDLRASHHDANQKFSASRLSIDHDFVETYQLNLVAGRDFRESDHAYDFGDLKYVLVNEEATRLLGFESPEQAVDQSISFYNKAWQIAGVLGDFHQQSLKLPIEPIIFPPSYSTYDFISLRLETTNLATSLEQAGEVYASIFPENPFEYFFMDQQFAQQYTDDQQFGQMVALFAVLAVIIACLGLLGLAVYSVLQRSKEIGIRKVLGASIQQLFILLSGRFMKLVGIATLVAMPIAWLAIQNWLENYAFHISVSLLYLLLPAAIILGIALLTISWQTISSARRNPVESLRRE